MFQSENYYSNSKRMSKKPFLPSWLAQIQKNSCTNSDIHLNIQFWQGFLAFAMLRYSWNGKSFTKEQPNSSVRLFFQRLNFSVTFSHCHLSLAITQFVYSALVSGMYNYFEVDNLKTRF